MKLQHVYAVAVIALPFGPQSTYSQTIRHSDVFFAYGDTRIEVSEQDGRLAFPQDMPQSGFFLQANTNPGFFSERDIGGGTGPSDRIGYNVLDDLVFWTDGAFASPREDTQIRVVNNPSTIEHTVIGTGTGEQRASFDPLLNSIGQSNHAGDFHSHVDYRLEPADPENPPPPGAYGIKLSLSTNNPEVGDSEPFFLVWRFGMDRSLFSSALDDFDALLHQLPNVVGDFDADGLLTNVDIDLLSQEVVSASNNAVFDLTNDAAVNEADRKTWVEDIKGTFFGDADLNGHVQFADFLALSAAFGLEGGWAEGDFDGSGDVAFSDFLLLSSNFGQVGDEQIANVPEPQTTNAIVFMFILFAVRTGYIRKMHHRYATNHLEANSVQFASSNQSLWFS